MERLQEACTKQRQRWFVPEQNCGGDGLDAAVQSCLGLSAGAYEGSSVDDLDRRTSI